MFVYVLGVSSFYHRRDGHPSDHLHRRFAAIAQYAIYGFIFYTLAMGMLLGS